MEEFPDALCTQSSSLLLLITNLVKTPTPNPSSGGEMEVGGSAEGRELLRVSCPFVLWKLFVESLSQWIPSQGLH